MTTARPHVPRRRRPGRTLAARAVRAAAIGCAIALLLFVIDVFIAEEVLRVVAVGVLAVSLIGSWIGVLAWRMPVFENRMILFIGVGWAAATSLAVWIILWTQIAERALPWRLVTLGFALSLSLVAAGLCLRALLRKRTSPLTARLLSLLSPLALLLWIAIESLSQ